MDIKHISTSIEGLNIHLNKAVSDKRGVYCDIAPGGTDNPLYADGIKHIHASIAKEKFIPRGGHYHYKLKEEMFTLSGTALWFFYDFNRNSPTFRKSYAVILGDEELKTDMEIPQYTIDKNSMAQISVPPYVYHIFWPLTDKDVVVSVVGTRNYDPKDYDRTNINDIPGAIDLFERVKKIISDYEKLKKMEKEDNLLIKHGNILRDEGRQKLKRKIKAVIPAAKSAQQRPFSHTINKHLIPLGGKPMIFYPIENLSASGIKEICIVTEKDNKHTKQIVGDGSRWNIKIEYEVQEKLTGIGGAVMSAREFIKDEPFVLYLGDNIVKNDISCFVNKFFDENLNGLLLLSEIEYPQMFGVPEIIDGKIVRVEERPMYPKSKFAVTGIYIYDKNVFDALKNIELSERRQYEISDIHNYYINSNLKLDYQIIKGWWKDRGSPNDLLNGNRFVLENCVFEKGEYNKESYENIEVSNESKIEGYVKIGKDSRILGNTHIRGPVVIGNGCMIKDSYIGPYTSMGNSSEICKSEIEHSLVMNNVNIFKSGRIINSVIGNNVSVTSRGDKIPKGSVIIVGENSSLEIQ